MAAVVVRNRRLGHITPPLRRTRVCSQAPRALGGVAVRAAVRRRPCVRTLVARRLVLVVVAAAGRTSQVSVTGAVAERVIMEEAGARVVHSRSWRRAEAGLLM